MLPELVDLIADYAHDPNTVSLLKMVDENLSDLSLEERNWVKQECVNAASVLVFTRQQFQALAVLMAKHTGNGIWSIQCHPLNRGLQFETIKMILPAMSPNYPYFRLHVNATFFGDWVEFSASLGNQKVVVLTTNSFRTVSSKLKTHIGGGRMYYAPSARPLLLEPSDFGAEPAPQKHPQTKIWTDIFPKATVQQGYLFQLYDEDNKVLIEMSNYTNYLD
jgi:hypothetical protein